MTLYSQLSNDFEKIANLEEEQEKEMSFDPLIQIHDQNSEDLWITTSDKNAKQQVSLALLSLNNYAEQCYKEKQYKKAENIWWSLMEPTQGTPTLRLATLFRKQHRYQSEVAILEQGIWLCHDQNSRLNKRLVKAKELAAKNKKRDLSDSFSYGD